MVENIYDMWYRPYRRAGRTCASSKPSMFEISLTPINWPNISDMEKYYSQLPRCDNYNKYTKFKSEFEPYNVKSTRSWNCFDARHSTFQRIILPPSLVCHIIGATLTPITEDELWQRIDDLITW